MNTYRLLHVEDKPDIRAVVEISLSLDPGIMPWLPPMVPTPW